MGAHPFYDSAALLALATSMMAANWFLLVAGALACLLPAMRSRIEEEQLLARFGAGYQTYRDQTGRYVPRILFSR